MNLLGINIFRCFSAQRYRIKICWRVDFGRLYNFPIGSQPILIVLRKLAKTESGFLGYSLRNSVEAVMPEFKFHRSESDTAVLTWQSTVTGTMIDHRVWLSNFRNSRATTLAISSFMPDPKCPSTGTR